MPIETCRTSAGSRAVLVPPQLSSKKRPHSYLHQWFLTLYINCLPLETVLVIWDVVVCEGLHVLLNITLSLLKVLQSVLLKLEFEDIVKFFKTMKAGRGQSFFQELSQPLD